MIASISKKVKLTPGPQTPGLIVLEHELTAGSVQAFMTAFPLMKKFNWVLKSMAELDGLGPYQNAKDATSPPTLVPLIAGGNGGAGLTSTTSSTTSSTPTPTANNTSSKASTRTGGAASALPNTKHSAASKLYLPRSTMLSLSVLLTLLISRGLV
jgi:chitin deacetylase